MFRSGDAVDGIIESIGEQGVKFKSDETETTRVRHDQMDSVTLADVKGRVKFSEEKMARLMTVPRILKNDPPTHLLLSVSGDYLRGRLLSMDAENVYVEIRLETKVIPRSKVARIQWLHERPWLDEEVADESKTDEPEKRDDRETKFLVHAVRSDSHGVTFAPQSLVDGRLSGTSDLLGQCSVRLDQIDLLLFGRNVGRHALALREESRVLKLATLPRAYQDLGDGGTLGVVASPLLGRKAPDINLDTIDGEFFNLGALRGKVVVLDFWASWCGPCIETMPKVERMLEDMGADDVELVAVNLQDSVPRAELAVRRMELTSTVVMDVDGEAGRYYEATAIPQTVIVDREGTITHVFVGGGPRFLEEFATAIEEVAAESH